MLVSIFGIHINLFELALFVVLLLWFPIAFFFRGTKVRLQNPDMFLTINFLLFAYICLIMTTYFVAINKNLVIKSLLKWFEISLFSFLIFYFCYSFSNFKKIYWLLLIGYLSIVVISVFNLIVTHNFLFENRILPGYPSVVVLALSLPFIRKKNKMVVLISLFCFLTAFFSLSRGVWIVLTILLIIYLKKNIRSKKGYIISFALLITIIVPFSSRIWDYIDYRVHHVDVSNSERFGMAKVAVQAISENPILGVGSLNFPVFLSKYPDQSFIVSDQPELLQPHNVFLQVAAEEGIIALFIFCSIIIGLYLIVFKESRHCAKIRHYEPYILGMRYLTVPLLMILFFGFISDQTRFFFSVFVGLTLSILRMQFYSKGDG